MLPSLDHYYYLLVSDHFESRQLIPGYDERTLKNYYDGLTTLDEDFYQNIQLDVAQEKAIFIREDINLNKLLIKNKKIDIDHYNFKSLPYSYYNKLRRVYLPKNCSILKKAQFFINFYKSVRRNKEKLKEMNNVYLYNFEDFCLNYEDTKKRFFNESKILLSANHQFKKKIFKPEESKKNIFMYKKISKDTLPAIKLIEKHLEEYLYYE